MDNGQAIIGVSLTVNGMGYIGSVTSFKVPEIVEKTEEYRGGLSAPRKIFVGYEPVEAEFKLSREDVALSVARAIIGRDAVMTFRAVLDERGQRIPVKWTIYGRIYSAESGDVEAGKMVEKTYKVAVEKYLKTINGKPAEAFDIAQGELKLGDANVLEEIKKSLGV